MWPEITAKFSWVVQGWDALQILPKIAAQSWTEQSYHRAQADRCQMLRNFHKQFVISPNIKKKVKKPALCKEDAKSWATGAITSLPKNLLQPPACVLPTGNDRATDRTMRGQCFQSQSWTISLLSSFGSRRADVRMRIDQQETSREKDCAE